jgi:glycosyltransferase involved in cell wall biosynthesis
MNIIVDGRPFVASSAGISAFLKCSLQAWALQRPNDQFIVALPRALDKTFSADAMPCNVRFVMKTNSLLLRLPNLVWLNVVFPFLVRKYKVDVFYSALPCIPFFMPRKVKKVIVVHDVVNIEHASTMEWTNRLSNFFFFSRSVKNADVLWTNSHYTRRRIAEYYPDIRCKEIFTGCAIDNGVYHKLNITEYERTHLLTKYNIQGDFMLFVGSLEPRKNLEFLLSIMPELYKRTGKKLVVVGAKAWRSSSLKDVIENDGFPKHSVVFCKFVPESDLVRLYNMASCLVSASLNEGFGMPQLEALYCGCPIVTARNSAMIEVADGKSGAYTVEGYEPETWINTIEKVLETRPEPMVEELREYDWNDIIRKFTNKYNM